MSRVAMKLEVEHEIERKISKGQEGEQNDVWRQIYCLNLSKMFS
jgi:hypothetical protein